jgi:site-specific recombinase
LTPLPNRLRQRLTRQTWWPRPGTGFDIESLLDSADAHATLAERHIWLIRLLDWVRRGEPVSGSRYVLRLLMQDAARRDKVVALLAAFWRDVDVAALLADFGFSPRSAFLNELGERLRRRALPQSPDTGDLAVLFGLLFDHPDDAAWLADLDDSTLDDLGALWARALAHPLAQAPGGAGALPDDNAALGWREPFYDAMLYLASQVRAAGFSPAFRSRIGMRVDADFDAGEAMRSASAPTPSGATDGSARLAFRQLARVVEQLRERAVAQTRRKAQPAPHDTAPDAASTARGLTLADTLLLQEAQYLRGLLDACAQAASGLHGHLEVQGISVDLVFQIDQLCERCRRIEQLLEVVLAEQPTPALRHLLVRLVQTGQARRSVRALFSQHYALLARKVAERSAETGEHYITRNRSEYLDMLARAGGGGAVLAGTTFMKFVVLALGLSPFWTGMGAGLNYAASFVIVQWLHFTVATKQPAMTAPAMAAKLADTHSEAGIEAFVDEVAHLIRSQMAGIVGNLAVVAPLVLGVQGLSWWLLGHPVLGEHSAHHVLDTLTLLGPTAWYAAFTGVLLFAASLVAGWVENWFVLHRLDSALRHNPRIRAWLGTERAARWADWWRHNISGLAANVSLGFMLGLLPVVAGFVAAALDVRHVTLSTGQLMAALGTLGPAALHEPAFWWCVAALPVTGLLNVGVSFALALRVAVRARGVRLKDRARLRAAIWQRLRRQPLSFVLPPRESASTAD